MTGIRKLQKISEITLLEAIYIIEEYGHCGSTDIRMAIWKFLDQSDAKSFANIIGTSSCPDSRLAIRE